jgi:hypothetical protein
MRPAKPKRETVAEPTDPLAEINQRLDTVLAYLADVLWYSGRLLSTQSVKFKHLTQEIRRMAGELDRLTQEVEESTTVQQGAITLLNQLGELIRSNVNDPARLAALADQLDAQAAALGEAVAANTPAEPEPEP